MNCDKWEPNKYYKEQYEKDLWATSDMLEKACVTCKKIDICYFDVVEHARGMGA